MAKAKKEEKPVLERTYTIPLRKEWLKVPKYKRAKKAVKAIREFLARHMKVPERDTNKVKLDMWLNRALWIRGIKSPAYKISVKATKDSEGNVKAELVGLPKKYKVEEAKLLKKKAKKEAKAKVEEEKRKKELEKKAEEAKKKAESEKKLEEEAKKEKTEEEKTEGKEKKEQEAILHKETPKPLPEEKGVWKMVADGKREKQEMRRKVLKK